ncbi:MAG: hypothetical protein K2N01_03115 [Lachnospiraceae bacterium]|nr:hypothetical protein [Lachnospiraceae bacterium]
MIIKSIALGNLEEAYVEERLTDGVNIIFSDDNNKGKTLVMQGIMYAMGNQPIFPKGFNYRAHFFYCKIEVNKREIEFLRRDSSFVVKNQEKHYTFDNMTELKYFLVDEHIFDIPQIIKEDHMVVADLNLFYELFFIGQDKRNPSNTINSGYNNKKDFVSMLCSMNGYPLMHVEEINAENKQKIQQIKADIAATKKQLKLIRKNPDVSGYVDKYSDSTQFGDFRMRVKSLHNDIAEFKKKRNLEYNRKAKLEALVYELNSLNREIEQGNVICAKCGSEQIIYKSKGMSFEVSNSYVRKQVLSSIAYQISQKEEIIREYSYQLQQLQDELKKTLQEVPVELHRILLYSEMILSEIDYDNKLKEMCEQLEKLQANDKNISNSEKEAKQKCKEMKEDIVLRMNSLYREVDPQGRTFIDDIFTKKDETYSGSEEQEYYYSRILAINDYFKHSYPLLVDCYRSGEISSQKEDIMIKNFISRKKQVIITSTLKAEEYNAQKYEPYKGNANVIDYSNNESSKLLQPRYVGHLRTIVESFGVVFEETC